MQTSTSGEVPTLKTVDRALSVLETIAAAAQPLNVRQIADSLGLNLSTSYHLVNTLISRGYVSKDAYGGLRVGSKISTLHSAFVRGSDLVREVRPTMEKLRADTGETVYLTRWVDGAAVLTAVLDGIHSLRVTGLEVGLSGSEDRRASGKAIMAWLDQDELDTAVQQLFGSDTEKSAHLQHLLAIVRRDGYAFDDEDFEAGICCISAPFFSSGGKIEGSITVSAPSIRKTELTESVREKLLQAARSVSSMLDGPQNKDH